MALPDSLKWITPATGQISCRDHDGGVAPTAANDLEVGTPTDVEMNPSTLAAGSWWQGPKFDFGVNRDQEYVVGIACEWSSAPTAGGTVDIYLSWSDSATAGTANSGNASGADGAYVGYGAAATDADEAAGQLDYVGSLAVTNDIAVQTNTSAGVVVPRKRYACLIIKNNTSTAFGPDDNEWQVVLTPAELQNQD